MARKPTGKPNGRPKKVIDFEIFKKLCALQCTKEEIAGFFDCSEDTIEKFCKNESGERFSALYKKFSQSGKISLRRSQFRLAETNSAMAIFLGKQYLGQSDSASLSLKGESDSAPVITFEFKDVSFEKNENNDSE